LKPALLIEVAECAASKTGYGKMRTDCHWSKVFLKEIESHRVDDGIALWHLGSPSFLYQTPKTNIYIDPYFGPTPPEAEELYPNIYRATAVPLYPPEITKADAVISTHDHTDHCHEPTLLPMQEGTPAVFVAPETSTARMLKAGLSRDRIQTVKPGDTVKINDVEIQVFDSHDPDAPGAVTYLLVCQGVTLFVSGDTRDGETLAQIGDNYQIDLALLTFGGFYNTHEQMLAVANRLKPKVLLPFHWEVWRGATGNPMLLGRTLERNPPTFDVRLLQMGDRIRYTAEHGVVTQ
jgi:L-ascorbate metabolism protein UlaG (beta-lactamase superfamily)